MESDQWLVSCAVFKTVDPALSRKVCSIHTLSAIPAIAGKEYFPIRLKREAIS